MTMLKLLSAGMIAAAMLATPAMAQEGRVMPRHVAANPDAGATPPGVLYIDGRVCYPAPVSAHLPHSPGRTARTFPATPRRIIIDPSPSRSGLAVRCRQATNPDRYRSGPSIDVTGLEDVGPGFLQPDFFVTIACRSAEESPSSRRVTQAWPA